MISSEARQDSAVPQAENRLQGRSASPYTYSPAPFLADPKAIQHGDITEDALLRGSQMAKPPVILLLADDGFENYTTTASGV